MCCFYIFDIISYIKEGKLWRKNVIVQKNVNVAANKEKNVLVKVNVSVVARKKNQIRNVEEKRITKIVILFSLLI